MAGEKPDSFQCGAFEVSKNPNVLQFVEKLNRLREAIDQCRLQPGVGYTLNRSSGGTTLSIKTSSGIAEPAVKRPFALSIRKKDKKYEFYVTTGSVNIPVKIENLEKWVKIDSSVPAVIYLEVQINSLVVESATIKSNAQNYLIKTIEMGGGKQTFARMVIGFYVSGGNNSFYVVQNVVTNIKLTNVCYDGYPALALSPE
jgi:hypothetical protein